MNSLDTMAILDCIIITSLLVIALKILASINHLELIIFASIFSTLSALLYLLLNAPDVSITEVSVGACLTTIFLLRASSILAKNPKAEARPSTIHFLLFTPFIGIFFFMIVKTMVFTPPIGAINDITNNDVYQFYLDKTQKLMDFPNIVTAVLANFRGLDTLVETLVLLTAGTAVVAILRDKSQKLNFPAKIFKKPSVNIVSITLRIMLPFMVMCAFYVQAHGELSPGGGFQSGSILASAFIAYALLIDEATIKKFWKKSLLLKIGATGSLIYLITGLFPMALGVNFLTHSNVFCKSDASVDCKILSTKIAIFLIELGVGTTVFSVMLLIFLALSINEKSNSSESTMRIPESIKEPI